MVFSLAIFFYAYLAFLLVWFVFSSVATYHMIRFGFKNFLTTLVLVIYAIVSLLILAVSFYFIDQIDWSIEVDVFKNLFDLKGPFLN